MPKVRPLNETQYKVNEFSDFLRRRWREQGLRTSDIAEWLDITQQAVSYKLKTGAFSLKDIITIIRKTQLTEQEVTRYLGGIK